jgi:hypothetical protein
MLGADNQQERLLNSENLNWYLSGFIDGEGCFSISIRRSKFSRLGWTMNPLFQVYQHKDKDNAKVLSICKNAFGCGYISEKGGNLSCFTYCIDKINNLIECVIPFFDKYPLVGEKYQNFLLFKQIVLGISEKKHLTKEGFLELAELTFQMNKQGKYRKIKLETIQADLAKSSETIRQTLRKQR